jgi:hypothetical protein
MWWGGPEIPSLRFAEEDKLLSLPGIEYDYSVFHYVLTHYTN